MDALLRQHNFNLTLEDESMRSSNKSRSRNKNNNRRNNNSGGNVINRVFDSAGPTGRVRGTPQQIIEKYRALAHDALLDDDRVGAESYHQYAEHYSRLLVSAQKQMDERQAEHAQRQAEQQAQRQQKQQQQSVTEVSVDAQPDVSGGFEANAGEQPDVSDNNIVATPEGKQKASTRAPRTRKKFTPEPAEAETPPASE